MNRLINIQNPGKRMARKAKTYRPPTAEEIALHAYFVLAQEDPQRARDAWRQAEAQLIADRQHDAGLLPSSEAFLFDVVAEES